MQILNRIKLKKDLEKRFEGIKVKYTKNSFECDTEKLIIYLPKERNLKSDFYFWTWYEKYYNTTIKDDAGWFEMQLDLIEKIGEQNWLAKQM